MPHFRDNGIDFIIPNMIGEDHLILTRVKRVVIDSFSYRSELYRENGGENGTFKSSCI